MQIIDGGALAFAAFHALKGSVQHPLTHQVPLMLAKLVDEVDDTLAICWNGDAQWKRVRFPGYRPRPEIWQTATPTDFDNLLRVLGSLGVLQFRHPELEADEILASLVHALDGTEPILIRSDDKDFMQLLTDTTWMHGRVRGLVTANHVESIMGVTPDFVADLQALVGDKVDGIPALASDERARRLIREYGHVPDWPDSVVTEQLSCNPAQLALNYELVNLSVDALGPVPYPLAEGYADQQVAKDIGKRLKIAHLIDQGPALERLFDAGTRTTQSLASRGIFEA